MHVAQGNLPVTTPSTCSDVDEKYDEQDPLGSEALQVLSSGMTELQKQEVSRPLTQALIARLAVQNWRSHKMKPA